MQNQEFISEIQRLSGVESSAEGLKITRAVLETLADHLAGNAPAKLAAQLPEEIGAMITEHKNDPNAEGEGFGVDEFIRRTAGRAELTDATTAKNYAAAVFATLRASLSEGEYEKMRGTLPAEYDVLFGDHAGKTADSDN